MTKKNSRSDLKLNSGSRSLRPNKLDLSRRQGEFLRPALSETSASLIRSDLEPVLMKLFIREFPMFRGEPCLRCNGPRWAPELSFDADPYYCDKCRPR